MECGVFFFKLAFIVHEYLHKFSSISPHRPHKENLPTVHKLLLITGKVHKVYTSHRDFFFFFVEKTANNIIGGQKNE